MQLSQDYLCVFSKITLIMFSFRQGSGLVSPKFQPRVAAKMAAEWQASPKRTLAVTITDALAALPRL